LLSEVDVLFRELEKKYRELEKKQRRAMCVAISTEREKCIVGRGEMRVWVED